MNTAFIARIDATDSTRPGRSVEPVAGAPHARLPVPRLAGTVLVQARDEAAARAQGFAEQVGFGLGLVHADVSVRGLADGG